MPARPLPAWIPLRLRSVAGPLAVTVAVMMRPAGLLAGLGIAGALALGGLALRGSVLEAARRDLDVQAGLAAEAVSLSLAAAAAGGRAITARLALPAVDLGPGGAIALFSEDGAVLARLPHRVDAEPEDYGLPADPGEAGIARVDPAGPLPARLIAWRHLPEHGMLLVASREAAVVLLPWTRGMQAVAAALVAVLGIAAAYGASAAAASARARRSDAALSLSEARAALVADALDVAIWFRDSPTGITRFFGDSVERITGRSRRLLESRPGTWTDIVQHPADRPALRAARAAADAADARGEPPSDRQATFRIIRPDGAVRWLHSRTRRLGDGSSVGVLHDVTDLTLAQAALARREAELAEILRIARLGTLRLPAERDVAEPSPELVEQWHIPEGAGVLTLDQVAALMTPETREAALAALAGVRRGGGTVDVEFSLKLPDGAVRHAWARIRREDGPDGEAGAVVAVCQDITERRAATLALARAQRMSALGHLTGGVAHDFNNLLTVVLLHLERLADVAAPESAERASAGAAMRAAETAAQLTAQLLAFAGRQRLRPATVDPSVLLCDLAPTLGRLLGPRIALSATVAPGTPPVFADPTQLRTALLNLAANARDAMDGRGRLAIAVAPDRPGWVAFTIADTGCGMTPEVAARAFEPFFTTKPAGLASGLGLSEAYGFAAQSRGEIAIDSAPGRGTTIRLVLPAGEPAAPTGGAASPLPAAVVAAPCAPVLSVAAVPGKDHAA
jgi:signal transduction histidine kinase